MPFLTRFLLFATLALALGLGSAWLAVGRGFPATTVRVGPWAFWIRQGGPDTDPYTLAHIAREGTLPMTASSAMTFAATRDSAGARLSGDCTYEVRGYAAPALWWNIAAFGADGRAMSNKTGRSSFSSATIATAPDGSYLVRLSPNVQPGNWLPSERGKRMVLRLEILRPLSPDNLLKPGEGILPAITLMGCA